MPVDSVVPPGGGERVRHESLHARTLGASLTVSDLRRSLTWYRDVMGFTVDREYQRDRKARAFRLRDPDGFRFTISSER